MSWWRSRTGRLGPRPAAPPRRPARRLPLGLSFRRRSRVTSGLRDHWPTTTPRPSGVWDWVFSDGYRCIWIGYRGRAAS